MKFLFVIALLASSAAYGAEGTMTFANRKIEKDGPTAWHIISPIKDKPRKVIPMNKEVLKVLEGWEWNTGTARSRGTVYFELNSADPNSDILIYHIRPSIQ